MGSSILMLVILICFTVVISAYISKSHGLFATSSINSRVPGQRIRNDALSHVNFKDFKLSA